MAKCVVCGKEFEPKIEYPLTCGSKKCSNERSKKSNRIKTRINRLKKQGIDITKGYCQICYEKVEDGEETCSSKQCKLEYQYQKEQEKRKTRPFSHDTDLLIAGELLKGTSKDETARILADILTRDYAHLRQHIDEMVQDGTYDRLSKMIKERRKEILMRREVTI
jgi:predicted nucleic acid-binding Zn ribbon protein